MITFFSNALSAEVEFDKLDQLDHEQLQSFHDELRDIVIALNRVVTDAKAKEQVSGIPLDANWLHKVNTKKRIALKFAAEANSRLQGGSTLNQRVEYERIYKERYRKMLVEEFGEEELQSIEREIVDEAREEYKKWIASTGQRMWFIP
jgi:hypothetical protein